MWPPPFALQGHAGVLTGHPFRTPRKERVFALHATSSECYNTCAVPLGFLLRLPRAREAQPPHDSPDIPRNPALDCHA